MAENKVLYAEQDGVVFIKMCGVIRYTTVLGFDVFVDRLARRTDVTDLLVDLSEAEYLDSTHLGLLAVLAGFIHKKGGFKAKIITNAPAVTELIKDIGLDRVFVLITNTDTCTVEILQEIPSDEKTELDKAKMILSAHKAIMDLSEKNRTIFHNVVELLQNDVDRAEQQGLDL